MASGRSLPVQRHPLNPMMNFETVNLDPLAWDLSWCTLDEFIPCGPLGKEGQAAERIAKALRELGVETASLQRIKIAVVQAVLNVIDRKGQQKPESRITIRVLVPKADLMTLASERVISQQITDQADEAAPTMLQEARLSCRSWGFFLVEKSKGASLPTNSADPYTIELFLYTEGDEASNGLS